MRGYITNMAARYANYHNVEDFIERRLREMIKTYAKSERPDIAKVLEEALNNYLQGNYDIVLCRHCACQRLQSKSVFKD